MYNFLMQTRESLIFLLPSLTVSIEVILSSFIWNATFYVNIRLLKQSNTIITLYRLHLVRSRTTDNIEKCVPYVQYHHHDQSITWPSVHQINKIVCLF
jgi:hypothetical protein